MKECDHQFDLSGEESQTQSQVHDTMLVRIACLSVISDQQASHHPVTLTPITLSVSFLKTFFRLSSLPELMSFSAPGCTALGYLRSLVCLTRIYVNPHSIPDLSSSGGEF